jgi:hypothetical protein
MRTAEPRRPAATDPDGRPRDEVAEAVAPRRVRHRALTVVALGIALGAVDLLLQRGLPYPWANLANSSAVWALGAFGVGWWWLHARPWGSALAGVGLLVVAVQAYYVAAVVLLNDDAQVCGPRPRWPGRSSGSWPARSSAPPVD